VSGTNIIDLEAVRERATALTYVGGDAQEVAEDALDLVAALEAERLEALRLSAWAEAMRQARAEAFREAASLVLEMEEAFVNPRLGTVVRKLDVRDLLHSRAAAVARGPGA